MDNKFSDLLKHGKFYNPAYLHYPNSTLKKVQCDSCENVTNVSLGYGQMDLCMLCTHKLTL